MLFSALLIFIQLIIFGAIRKVVRFMFSEDVSGISKLDGKILKFMILALRLVDHLYQRRSIIGVKAKHLY